ncbi:MAG TPA: serine/threonine-protein kinase, partial [Vicinamibacterales bacterium]
MTLGPGARLGAYDVLSLIGSGGMGEVYRSLDTRLGRDVAVKVLPATFTGDPERVARFRREAQVLASLNHPHIAQIYGLEEAAGTQFLVLELIDGESLDRRIARGPIPVDEATPIAVQIAEALEAAHEKGIVHRDLKPANVAVTHDGQVKVLDFGLAKAIDTSSSTGVEMTQSPTITSPAMMTAAGMILGTAAYMSPEQAKGRPADKRSDIWAFGCVLFEMLTGKRAFVGEDVSDTLAAILRGEPDWSALPSGTPANLRTILTRCLARDRRQRFGDVSTVLFLLSEPRPASVAAARTTSTRSVLFASAIAAAVAAAVTASVMWLARPINRHPPVTRLAIPLPEGVRFSSAGRHEVAVSADGMHVAFVAAQRLYVRSLADIDAKAITDASVGSVTSPAFSPDGREIAFYSPGDDTIKHVATEGGVAQTVCSARNPFGISWDTTNHIWIGQGLGGIIRVPAGGGAPEHVLSVANGERAHGPQLLPDGDHLLFTLAKDAGASSWDGAQIVVQSLKTGEQRVVINGGSDARYLPTGHIVYAVGGVLYAVPFDAQRLAVTGPASPILEGVARSVAAITGSAQFGVSDTGTLVYVPGPVNEAANVLALVLFDRNGNSRLLKAPPMVYQFPRVSPDGRQVAVDTDDSKNADIWILSLADDAAPRRLT